jgi:hypothetical protein
MLENIKQLVLKKKLGIDLEAPVDALLFIPLNKRKKGREKVNYEPVKILRVNLSNAEEILYLIETENGTRKYVESQMVKTI